ncbi:hypothetical protein BLNAU_4770 [Blattamonas nauphoetae]|uniref:Uncharacterized protein n=1 Tax=Blattamonas nauphoetae TaxID=2049346 RepID=A0ABQ9Y909_9EUKA|nr:hypothetical protein BLNAU_4770 [Blattamonas nauphoetae]
MGCSIDRHAIDNRLSRVLHTLRLVVGGLVVVVHNLIVIAPELCGRRSVIVALGSLVSCSAVLERSLVLMGDFVFGEEDYVELCEYVSVGHRLTVLMKHLEFVLPLYSAHPQSIIAVMSARLFRIDCVSKSLGAGHTDSSLLLFHATLPSTAVTMPDTGTERDDSTSDKKRCLAEAVRGRAVWGE